MTEENIKKLVPPRLEPKKLEPVAIEPAKPVPQAAQHPIPQPAPRKKPALASRSAKDTAAVPGKSRQLGRAIRRHFVNYLFIAIAGTILVTVGSTLAKAYWTKAPCDKAAPLLADGKANEVLDMLQSSSRFETMFPSLRPRRDILTIRCHIRQNELEKAMGIADAMASTPYEGISFPKFMRGFVPPETVTELVDRFSYFINHMERPLAAAVDQIFRKQNVQTQLNGWSGYSSLADELKAANNSDGLTRLLTTVRRNHPDAPFTESLTRYMDKAQRLAKSGKKMPHPNAIKNAPIGWAYVKAPNTSIFDSTGSRDRIVAEGTLIEVDEIRDSKSGTIIVGSIHYRKSQKNGIIVRAKDLALKRGLIFEIDASVKAKLFTRAELTQKIANSKKSAQDRLSSQNPHLAEYKRVKAEYDTFWNRVNDITAKHKTATGTQREKYFAELRVMKGKDIALGQKLKASKTKAQSWIKANSHLAAAGPEVAQLKQQLDQVESELQQLGYL